MMSDRGYNASRGVGGRSATASPPPSRGAGRQAGGFSLMEVLIAIGLLALGFVAVAAIFPTGAYLQRETAHEVHTRNLEVNIRANVEAMRVSHSRLTANYTWTGEDDIPGNAAYSPAIYGQDEIHRREFDLRPMTNHIHNPLSPPPWDEVDVAWWPLGTRSGPVSGYPSANTIADLHERRFVWVPLLRHRYGRNDSDQFDPEGWQMIVFVLQRQRPAGDAAYLPMFRRGAFSFMEQQDPDLDVELFDYPFTHGHEIDGVDDGDIAHALPKLARIPLASPKPVEHDDGRRRVFVLADDIEPAGANDAQLHIQVGDRIVDSFGRRYRVAAFPYEGDYDRVLVDTHIVRAEPARERFAHPDRPVDREPDAIWIAPRAMDDDGLATHRHSPVHAIFSFDLPAHE